MKKGFTLVELLAVIVILSVIALITTISVTSIISDSKNELSDIQKRTIEGAAETYFIKEGMDENATCVNVSYLLNEGYLKGESVKNPKDNQNMVGSVQINPVKNDKQEIVKYNYVYQEQECTSGGEATSVNVN